MQSTVETFELSLICGNISSGVSINNGVTKWLCYAEINFSKLSINFPLCVQVAPRKKIKLPNCGSLGERPFLNQWPICFGEKKSCFIFLSNKNHVHRFFFSPNVFIDEDLRPIIVLSRKKKTWFLWTKNRVCTSQPTKTVIEAHICRNKEQHLSFNFTLNSLLLKW